MVREGAIPVELSDTGLRCQPLQQGRGNTFDSRFLDQSEVIAGNIFDLNASGETVPRREQIRLPVGMLARAEE